MRKSIALLVLTVLINGCLKTRAELRGENTGEPEMRQQTRVQQQAAARESRPAPATPAARFEEYDEQMRNLNGRVDSIENHLAQLNAAHQGEKNSVTEMAKYSDQKFQAYEEELKKLRAELAALNEEVQRLKVGGAIAAANAAPVEKTAGKAAKTPYDEGEELFNNKKWKEAIVNYQKYRDNYPKGKLYADATYKIGVCFQELKMKDESRAFFEEVIAKFPGSKEAKKAAFRMKSLK